MELEREERLRKTHELVEIYDSLIQTWLEVKKIKEALMPYDEEKRLLLECGLIMNILRPLCDTRRYSLLHEAKYDNNKKKKTGKDTLSDQQGVEKDTISDKQ